MAYFFSRTLHTFKRVPCWSPDTPSGRVCVPANRNPKDPGGLKSKTRRSALTMNVPMVSAVMQAVSERADGHRPCQGRAASPFISSPKPVGTGRRKMFRRVKNHKGFVTSDFQSADRGHPGLTLLAWKIAPRHSTMAVTHDGTGTGRLLACHQRGLPGQPPGPRHPRHRLHDPLLELSTPPRAPPEGGQLHSSGPASFNRPATFSGRASASFVFPQ